MPTDEQTNTPAVDPSTAYLLGVYALSELLSLMRAARVRLHAGNTGTDVRLIQHAVIACVCHGSPPPEHAVQNQIIQALAMHVTCGAYPWAYVDDADELHTDSSVHRMAVVPPCATGVPRIDERAQALRRLLLAVYEQARSPESAAAPGPAVREALSVLLGSCPGRLGTADADAWRDHVLSMADKFWPRLSPAAQAYVGSKPDGDTEACAWAAETTPLALIHQLSSGRRAVSAPPAAAREERT